MIAQTPSMRSSILPRLAGKHLLVTGASGFIAKLVVEKILRSVPTIGGIHLLLRRSGRHDAQSRWRRQILPSSVFDRLRLQWGDQFHQVIDQKIHLWTGDLSQDFLGLSPQDYASLTWKIDGILHCAATVRFDEPADLALQVNTLGPRRLLTLAQDADSIPMVHVSTCYVSGFQTGQIPERVMPWGHTVYSLRNNLPATFDVENEIHARLQLTQELREQHARQPGKSNRDHAEFDQNLRHQARAWARQHGWNDIYTFSKSMGEQLLWRDRGSVPLSIVRPSIVESTWAEPIRGWIHGLRMMDPIIAEYARGNLSSFCGNESNRLDLIPGDWVANAVLAAFPERSARHHAKVYQVATGQLRPLTLNRLTRTISRAIRRSPLRNREGRPIIPKGRIALSPMSHFQRRLENRLRLARSFENWAQSLWMTKQARFWTSQRRALQRTQDYVNIYGFYTHYQPTFLSDNTQQLFQSMTANDQKEFPFDLRAIKWKEYLEVCQVPGLKRWLNRSARPAEANQKTPPSTVPATVVSTPWMAGPRIAQGTVSHSTLQSLRVTTSPTSPTPNNLLTRRVDDSKIVLRRRRKRPMERGVNHLLPRYFDIQVVGLQNIPSHQPFLLISNHQSHLDFLAIRQVFSRRADLDVVVADDYFFDRVWRRWIINSLADVIPVDRTGRSHAGLKRCLSILKSYTQAGQAMVMFPEGSRSPDGQMQAFKSGVGYLACQCRLPVVPAYLQGTFDLLPKGRMIPKPGTIKLSIGQPELFGDVTTLSKPKRKEAYRHATDRLETLVRCLKYRSVPAVTTTSSASVYTSSPTLVSQSH